MVKAPALTHHVISRYLEKKDLAAEAQALARRALAPLLARPPPAWRHPVLLAAFGDAHLEARSSDDMVCDEVCS